ncbi:hypothetical protein BD311DRAFT_778868 [Dichomitus squalens]|uniref:F-box domain-containing protein n=1 Tax=Dichomitus squalens TaxID=114155 RepID=A0A4Q9MMW5_9APHY|nr:hypothetical protein BD311DRAFT_778868 [Dichomitus squalens]
MYKQYQINGRGATEITDRMNSPEAFPLTCSRFCQLVYKRLNGTLASGSPAMESESAQGAVETAAVFEETYGALIDTLSQMPKLHTLRLSASQVNGIPWEAMQAILAIPQLRALHITGTLDRRLLHPLEIERRASLPPASPTSLECAPRPYSDYPGSSLAQRRLLGALLQQPSIQHALATLAIPDECLPSDVFCSAQFPRLRDVSLRGRRGVWALLAGELHNPHVTALAGIPNLIALELNFAAQETPGRQPIWPASSPCATLPWQRLRHLSVSYPDPEDEVYSHLPTTLRSLALRCWPRHYLHTLPHDAEAMNWMGWSSPVLSASEMLRILRRCPSDRTDALEIEYVADDDNDEELLQFIPQADRRSASNALVPLRSLRVLRVHLDFPDAPHPLSVNHFAGHSYRDRTLVDVASTFARALAPGSFTQNRFVAFRVVRSNDGAPFEVRPVDREVEEGCGVSLDDGDGPRYSSRGGLSGIFPGRELYAYICK